MCDFFRRLVLVRSICHIVACNLGQVALGSYIWVPAVSHRLRGRALYLGIGQFRRRNEHWIFPLESASTKKLAVYSLTCMYDERFCWMRLYKMNVAVHINCITLSPFVMQWAVCSAQDVSLSLRKLFRMLFCLYCTDFLSVLQSVILPTEFADWFGCVWVVAWYRGKDAGEAAVSNTVMLLRLYF
jgi:hypothetical protein